MRDAARRSRRILVLLAGGMLLVLGATPAAAAAPGVVTLLAPAGFVNGSTLTFTWQADPVATFYYLQVNDSTASPRFTAWYPAGQACPASSATCAVTVSTGWSLGLAVWWIHPWNSDGYGPWSGGMSFTVRWVAGAWEQMVLPVERFALVLGQGDGVLDRETGLVWSRYPDPTNTTWDNAMYNCHILVLAGRRGWRLPSLEELASLLDPTRSNPALPAGHPFGGVLSGQDDVYWTASTDEMSNVFAYSLSFNIASNLSTHGKSSAIGKRWCVRGGASTDNPR
jgi:hypothetical protein